MNWTVGVLEKTRKSYDEAISKACKQLLCLTMENILGLGCPGSWHWESDGDLSRQKLGRERGWGHRKLRPNEEESIREHGGGIERRSRRGASGIITATMSYFRVGLGCGSDSRLYEAFHDSAPLPLAPVICRSRPSLSAYYGVWQDIEAFERRPKMGVFGFERAGVNCHYFLKPSEAV